MHSKSNQSEQTSNIASEVSYIEASVWSRHQSDRIIQLICTQNQGFEAFSDIQYITKQVANQHRLCVQKDAEPFAAPEQGTE